MPFGRTLSSYARGVARAPELAVHCAHAAQAFTDYRRVILAYLFGVPLPTAEIALRGGQRLRLSSNTRDVVTAFVVFAKRDYGAVPRGVVIDVGANVGCFSLYAVRCGARRVYAFEPSAEAFSLLDENVRRNGLARTIVHSRTAVTDGGEALVAFPVRSDPSNRVLPASVARSSAEPVEMVPATTLDRVLESIDEARVDLLKLDCEGSEYGIVAATSSATWGRIDRVRLEYHRGCAGDLIRRLRAEGFTLERHVERVVAGEAQGDLWFGRRHAAAS